MSFLSINSLSNLLRSTAKRLIGSLTAAGGRAYAVGGAVRDALMGQTAKDLDIEVYGLPPEAVERAIAAVAPFDAVGKSFGVYKLKHYPIDIALPRRESKSGTGHKGFEVVGDPFMTFEEACARRDFTINAILWDIASGELIDPCHGQADLEKKLLRHTSEHFSEDPLRVLRTMQFTARFQFRVDSSTIALCAKIEPEGLPAERLFEEWKKLLLKGTKPSLGLQFLRDCGWIRYYPELQAMIDCRQDSEWHPEGDVWTHTLHCLDGFALEKPIFANTSATRDAEAQSQNLDHENLIVGLAVLLHDSGKPAVTQFIDGHLRARGHDIAGVAIAEKFLRRLTSEHDIFTEVLPLIECHMRPRELFEAKAGDSAIRRLARKVVRIDRLVRVASADMHGRPPMSADFPEGPWLLEQARRLEIESQAPKPIIQGRHLVELGHPPSPKFKAVLEACYEAQLEGAFRDVKEGLSWLKEYLRRQQSSSS